MALTIFDPQQEMLRRMREDAACGRIKNGEDPLSWQADARSKLEKMLGLPLEQADPREEICWTRERENYTETRFILYSEKQVRVPCHLLLPKPAGASLPLMVCLQGHSTGMHISLGEARFPGDEEDIEGD